MRAFLLHSNEPTLELLLPSLTVSHGSSLPKDGGDDLYIIHWGAFHPDRGRSEVLQPVKSIVLALNPRRAAQTLRLHGIDSVLGAGQEEASGDVRSGRAAAQAALAAHAGRAAERRSTASAAASVASAPSAAPAASAASAASVASAAASVAAVRAGRGASAALLADERGDATGGTRHRWTREFVVPVFHLQALTLYERRQPTLYMAGSAYSSAAGGAGELAELGTEQPTYHGARAMREAVKAVYALGLDYAVVRIGVRSDGALAVLGLDPVPRLDPRLAELFAEAIRRFDVDIVRKRSEPVKHTAMLGADPEFVLRNARGKIAFASNYADKDGPFGCDAIVLRSFRKIYPLAELRPRPSTEVRQLVVNLHRTMQLAARRIADDSLEWLAGGMPVRGFPLGGHIHFSGVPLTSELLRALDNYVALPLVLIEDGTTGNRKPKYGFLGDFRRQRHGGFEYRVLPSWMVSPVVARGVLALAKLVSEHYRLLRRRPLDEPEVARAYYSGDKARIRPLLLKLWRDLERLDDYGRHEKYLIPLRRRLMLMQPWNEQQDIRPRWKVPPFS